MKTYTLTKEMTVPRPLEEVFEFFSRPENLARITPPRLGFRIISTSPILMKAGTQIDYTIRVMGIRLPWRTLISVYEPPHRFVDEQIQGPYAFWKHTHTFTDTGGGTLIRDEVRYALPFGPLGTLVRGLAVSRQLEGIFAYRAQVIAGLFGARGPAGDAPVSV